MSPDDFLAGHAPPRAGHLPLDVIGTPDCPILSLVRFGRRGMLLVNHEGNLCLVSVGYLDGHIERIFSVITLRNLDVLKSFVTRAEEALARSEGAS